MFPHLAPLEVERKALEALAASLVETRSDDRSFDNTAIPAGYTYLGQFITHDLTFDPTPVGGRAVDPSFLTDFRTPALDLDSVYGAGPELQPFFYKPAAPPPSLRIRLGKVQLSRNEILWGPAHEKEADDGDLEFDVFRLPDGTALIPDFRNDEHLVTLQLHVAFARFHNKVADLLEGKYSAAGEQSGRGSRPSDLDAATRTGREPHVQRPHAEQRQRR
jgi:hypothetical protein